MILITGGAWQGKEAFAKIICQDERIRIVNLHEQIRKWMKDGQDPYAMTEELVAKHPDAVITIAEMGCGVVPVDAFERAWREMTGRISCILASRAEQVYRVTCGIAVCIKTLPHGFR